MLNLKQSFSSPGEDLMRMKRKFKTMIQGRYINEGNDLIKLTDNKQEWFKNCALSSVEQMSNKNERIIYHAFIEKIISGDLGL